MSGSIRPARRVAALAITAPRLGIRRGAAVAIAATGIIHALIAPEHYHIQPYIGVLFVIGAVACLAVAVRLWLRSDWIAWSIGGLVAGGMFVGFVLSRTVGLPGYRERRLEATGIPTLGLEAAFVLAVTLELGFLAGWACERRRRAAVRGRSWP
jgi:hypothetical protein